MENFEKGVFAMAGLAVVVNFAFWGFILWVGYSIARTQGWF